MLSILWTKICSLFTAEKLGILLKILLTKAASSVIDEIKNKENQQKAYEFVKELNANEQLTVKEKASIFNKKLADWAKGKGKELSASVINCLRELAVIALKAEASK